MVERPRPLTVPRARHRITFNPTICRWCRYCELVCSLFHESTCSPSLSRMRIRLNTLELDVHADLCQQCDNPACIIACPVEGAFVVDEATGASVIDEAKCVSCGKCAEACPFNATGAVIYFNQQRATYVKCDLCNGNPQCVDACPTGALKYVELGDE